MSKRKAIKWPAMLLSVYAAMLAGACVAWLINSLTH